MFLAERLNSDCKLNSAGWIDLSSVLTKNAFCSPKHKTKKAYICSRSATIVPIGCCVRTTCLEAKSCNCLSPNICCPSVASTSRSRSCSLPHPLRQRQLTRSLCLRFGEAETILTEYSSVAKSKLYDEILREYGDNSCFVLQMLALIYRFVSSLASSSLSNLVLNYSRCIDSKTDRIGQSIDFHKKCLRLNPFLWSSFEALCSFGEKVDPSKYFNMSQATAYYSTVDSMRHQCDSWVSETRLSKERPFDGSLNKNPNGFSVSDLFALKVS